MTKKVHSCFLLLFIVLLMSCMGAAEGQSDNTPAFIKDVQTIREGPDSFVVDFSLCDKDMADTISDGKVIIEIIQTPYISYKGRPTVLFNQTRNVKKADFKGSISGIRYYSFGPISNSQFNHLSITGANYAIVNIYFMTPDGQILSSRCDLPIPL